MRALQTAQRRSDAVQYASDFCALRRNLKFTHTLLRTEPAPQALPVGEQTLHRYARSPDVGMGTSAWTPFSTWRGHATAVLVPRGVRTRALNMMPSMEPSPSRERATMARTASGSR